MRSRSFPIVRLAVIGVFILLLPLLVFAEIPRVNSYQGKVTDSTGGPVADDTYTEASSASEDGYWGIVERGEVILRHQNQGKVPGEY
jgi:hypothetical protein